MSGETPPTRLLDRPDLAPLWDELARRYGEGGSPPVSVTLRSLTDRQRHAVADLQGIPDPCHDENEGVVQSSVPWSPVKQFLRRR